MWIFLPNAFLSIVDKSDPTGKTLLVRGRVLGDIERVFPKAKIEVDAGTDYRFRARLPREEVVNVIADSVRNINWKNFKNQVHEHERHKAYEDCWQSMYTLQEQGRKMEFSGGGGDYVDDDLDDRP
jgi:hypothetical protein